MKNIFSVDVEDWFHILDISSTPPLDQWGRAESRVADNFYRLLDHFDRFDAKVTCFFLGWVAEKHPHLVKEAARRGHEIACHSYAHQLIYSQSREEFRIDISKAKAILEQIAGTTVRGYRAPGFSITNECLWALEELTIQGFQYDSSIFPVARGHGGIAGSELFPHVIHTPSGPLVEFPISVAPFLGKRVCFFGGGYFRLFPYFLIDRMTGRVNAEGRPVIYYIHPREIDRDQPRLSMGLYRKFKSYVNLRSTSGKLSSLMRDHKVTNFQQWISEHQPLLERRIYDYASKA